MITSFVRIVSMCSESAEYNAQWKEELGDIFAINISCIFLAQKLNLVLLLEIQMTKFYCPPENNNVDLSNELRVRHYSE